VRREEPILRAFHPRRQWTEVILVVVIAIPEIENLLQGLNARKYDRTQYYY
jgi:hypothetical protein